VVSMGRMAGNRYPPHLFLLSALELEFERFGGAISSNDKGYGVTRAVLTEYLGEDAWAIEIRFIPLNQDVTLFDTTFVS
jgi:hypothetical protein